MQKITIAKPGGHDRLVLTTCPDLTPGPGEVLIEVKAAGVNYADCVTRMGYYSSAKSYVGWPITPGFEVAGSVSAVGAEVEEHAIGSRVVALTRFGGYATHVVVPQDQVFALPSDLEMSCGAAFPTIFLTAYYALCKLAPSRPGSWVLVHSAAGGVGSALIQLAKKGGANVVGVVGRSDKVEPVIDLGADHVIDKSKEDLWSSAQRHSPRGYDVILDANGPTTLKKSYAHLAPMGRLVAYGAHSLFPRRGGRPNPFKMLWGYLATPRFHVFRMAQENRSIMAFNLSYLFDEKDQLRHSMEQLLDWLADTSIRLPRVRCHPLANAAQAHQELESGCSVGKLVLLP